jgi:uncharacterized protein (TIGR00369 family)
MLMNSRTLSTEEVNALMRRIHSIPIMETLSMEITGLEDGGCTAVVPRHEQWNGIFETFHGGILGTIADSITCFAILTKLGAEAKVATTDFNIRFLRPCLTDVTCKAEVIRPGKTLSLAEAKLYDTNQKLVAIAQVSYIRLE